MSCNLGPSHLIKPSRTLPIDTAKETCDKIEMGSFGPKWANLRKKLYDNEAYKKHCWHGSRMITWIPYTRQLGEDTRHMASCVRWFITKGFNLANRSME